MSMEHMEKIECPKCRAEGDFVIWQSINTQLDPETKDKVLNGEIFRFKCPKCGNVVNVQYDCLYHQMEDQRMIHLVGPDGPVDEAVDALNKIADGSMMPGAELMDSGYTFRIVRSQNQLREKIYILDQGLDDRVIELMKVIIISNMMIQQPEIKVAEFLLEINEGAPERFAVRTEDDKWGSVPFRQEFYDKIREDMIDPEDDGKKQYFVNRDWAIEYLDKKVPK